MKPSIATGLDSEAGFSLLELVVALGILSIGVLAAMQVYFGALNLQATNDVKLASAKAATQQLELIRSRPYALAALPLGAPVPNTYEGEPVVFGISGNIQPGPDAVVFDSYNFVVNRHVTERSDTGGVAYRRIVIEVQAVDSGPGNGVTTRQESSVYEGRGFETAPDDPPPIFVPDAPTFFTATVDVATDPSTNVVLSWTPPSALPDSYEINYSSDNGLRVFSAARHIDGTASTWSIHGLAANQTYEFTIRARNGALSSPITTALALTTPAAVITSCKVDLASITPESNPLSPPNRLQSNVNFEVATNGGCTSGLHVEIDSDSISITGTMNPSSNVYRFTMLNAVGTWSPGPRFADIFDDSTGTRVARIAWAVT